MTWSSETPRFNRTFWVAISFIEPAAVSMSRARHVQSKELKTSIMDPDFSGNP